VEKGQAMRFPWAEVSPISRLLSSPQLEARHFWVEVKHPRTGKKYKLPAPILGRFSSHTRPPSR
jgi:crotonobetainyl-CoA:carnitine CoA-transferase CaiB-like acyl-CoA transferase